ncbi:MAG TPA: rhodanese-like domain-containing protein [Pseudonocardiaceae bacterium]|nr:rhodanese-like domain-containing protein [Pseudonocardiaceae bacterium]
MSHLQTSPVGSRSIEEILAAARARLHRIQPSTAHEAQRTGAILVDIRPVAQRQEFGEIPGAVAIERNVLEWRFDPCSDARLPIADRYDLPAVIVCQEGYTSSLAAAALQDLGLFKATDVIGGFAAWAAEGLPVIACPAPKPSAGTGPRRLATELVSTASSRPAGD